MARLGIGVSAVFVIGAGVAWPVAFIGAIFTNLMLQGPAPIPIRAGAMLLGRAAVAMVAVWYCAAVLLAYPLFFLVALTCSIYAIFRFSALGGSMFLVVLLLISVLLIPSLLLTSPELAGTVALWLVINIALAILASHVFFWLFPPEEGPIPAKPAKPEVSESEASWRAARMTLVTAPYAILHFSFGWSAVLPLIFIAMLAMALSGAASAAMGRNLLVANVAGGIVAIMAYELVVIAPNFLFMAALVLTIMLAGAKILVSGGPYAPYAGSALNAIMVLFGGAMAPFGGDVDAEFLDRMLGIGFAVLYIAAAYRLVESGPVTDDARDVKATPVES